MAESPVLQRPDWDLPPGVHAFVTTRHGGSSAPPRASFNLGAHTGDDPGSVRRNRELLQQALAPSAGVGPPALQWLQQVHGATVFQAGPEVRDPPRADAAFTRAQGVAITVLTADCLPVLFCSDDGTGIAVAHAGWRGLQAGILEATLACFHVPAGAVSAWLGPAIGPCHFEVGPEVREAFLAAGPPEITAALADCFIPGQPGKWFADLYRLARLRLQAAGLHRVSGGVQCTWCHHDRFYSYRREPQTGRFATLIFRT